MKNQNRLNKKQLARLIARQSGVTIEVAEKCLTAFVEVFRDVMQSDGEIMLHNLGTFSVIHCRERRMYNPVAAQAVTLPPRRRVKFSPSAGLRLNE